MPHLTPQAPPGAYTAYIGRKWLWLAGLVVLSAVLLVAAVSLGAVNAHVSVWEAPAASPVTVCVWLLIPSGVNFTTKVPVAALP